MSRATQIISLITAEKMPTGLDMKFYYTHIEKTEEIKKLRREYQKTPSGRKKAFLKAT